MKQFFYSLFIALVFLALPNESQAWGLSECSSCSDCSSCCSSCFSDWDIAVEGRVAYFRPTAKKVKEIYGNGWADYQLEISQGFCNNWRLWAGVSGFQKSGHSLGYIHHKTSLRLIPVTLGLKYLFNCAPCVDLYLGAGLSYSFLHIKDHSPFVRENTKKRAFGGIFQVGAYYNFSECFFADIFVDYMYQKFHFSDSSYSSDYYVERRDVDLSGFKVGAGLGWRF